jgi:signal transduction histidine kinase
VLSFDRLWKRPGLRLLPMAPAVVVVVGFAVAVTVTFAGVADLRRASDEAASLRSIAIANTLASRLRVTGSEDRADVIQQARRGTDADILLIDQYGNIAVDASAQPPAKSELLSCLVAGAGETTTLLGRMRFAVLPLGPPVRHLSVVAFVPAPLYPPEARGLAKAIAALTALLVGAAAAVAYMFGKDVRSDVTYVQQRIVAMAEGDAGPAGTPIPVRAVDQVGVLTCAFNVLVARFAAAERSYRQDLAVASTMDGDRAAFLAALSHELRTPLNAVLGFADVLLGEVDGRLDTDSRENLEVIRASASHLRSLIDDILELSALESGGLRLQREPVDVYAIAQAVVREASPTAAAKGLDVSLVGTAGLIANADPRRLRQVLGNVIGNAVKFTRQGCVTVFVERTDGHIAVHTVDTGPGIAQAERKAIFEEYRQAGDAAARRAGTGLGLAIARRLVEMHGGAIEVQSTVGRGSRFSVMFPAFTPEAP